MSGQDLSDGLGESEAGPNREFRFKANGTFQCEGNIQAGGTKNFVIPHPTLGKRSLRHASIEGPSGDLLYSGTTTLVEGKAVVDLDQVSNMTTGTFVALAKNSRCFTTNETDWIAVKGKVNGSVLTIESKNKSSTTTVSWMVIATRKDKNYLNSDSTNENGEFITEF